MKNHSLLTQDFKAGQLPAGPQGHKGRRAPRGRRAHPARSTRRSCSVARSRSRARTRSRRGTRRTDFVVCPSGYEAVGGGAWGGPYDNSDGSVVVIWSAPRVASGAPPDSTNGAAATGWTTARSSTSAECPVRPLVGRLREGRCTMMSRLPFVLSGGARALGSGDRRPLTRRRVAPGRDRERERHPDDARQLGPRSHRSRRRRRVRRQSGALRPSILLLRAELGRRRRARRRLPQTVHADLARSGFKQASLSPGAYRYIAAEGARACRASQYALYTGASGEARLLHGRRSDGVHLTGRRPGHLGRQRHDVLGSSRFDGKPCGCPWTARRSAGQRRPLRRSATRLTLCRPDFQIGYYPGAAARAPHPGSQALARRGAHLCAGPDRR